MLLRQLTDHFISFLDDIHHLRTTYLRRFSKLDIIESADFEDPDGENIRLTQAAKSWKDNAIADSFTYGLAAIVALLVALIYSLIYVVTSSIDNLRTLMVADILFVDENYELAFALYFSTMLAIALTGSLAVMYEPGAAGSLNGMILPKYVNLRVLIIRVFGVICILSAGLYSGYDGPVAYCGLAVASLLFSTVERFPKFSRMLFADKENVSAELQEDLHYVLNVAHKHFGLLFSASGAASGIASAFHAPLGGSMFALEEAISFYTPAVIIRTLFTSLLAFLFVGAVTNAGTLGDMIITEQYALFPTDADCIQNVAVYEVLSFAVMGVLAGAFGNFYNRTIMFILRFKIKYLWPRPIMRLVEVAVVCLITSLIVIYVPKTSLGRCHPFEEAIGHLRYIDEICVASCGSNVQQLIVNEPKCFGEICVARQMRPIYEAILFERFANVSAACAQNQTLIDSRKYDMLVKAYKPPKNVIFIPEQKCYFQLQSLLFGTPDEMIRMLFSRGTYGLFDAATLAVFSVIYLFLSLLTHNIMLPTDLVLPNIVLGASLGRLYGVLVNQIKLLAGIRINDPGSYALLGAAALWSGTARIAMTIAIVMMESTFDFSNIPGVIIVVFCAATVGNWFGHSLYHMEIEERNIPFLPDTAPAALSRLSVADIMDKELIVLHEKESGKTLFSKLASCVHQGFPVVRDIPMSNGKTKMKPVGIVLRSQLRMKILNRVQLTVEEEIQLEHGSMHRKHSETLQRRRRTSTGTLQRHDNHGGNDSPSTSRFKLPQLELLKRFESTSSSPRSSYASQKPNELLGKSDIEMKKRGSVDILQEAQSDSNSRRLSSESIAVPGVKLVGEVPIDDTDLIFNLSRLMSHPPHTVHVDMAAKKAYTMFRHLGLRHLCVVDSDFHLVGFITRKNFSRVIHDHDHPPDEEDNIDELAEGLPPPVTA